MRQLKELSVECATDRPTETVSPELVKQVNLRPKTTGDSDTLAPAD